MDLNGKVALITGGSKGIGAATAVKLAALGADVAIAARHGGENVDRVKEAVSASGKRCVFIAGDMSLPDEAAGAVKETVSSLGGIDVLIHNAGGPAPGDILSLTPEAWQSAFDVHVHAAFHLCRTAVPHMKARGGGAIVLLSSVAGIRGVPGILAYGVVKSCLIQFARGMARDLADYKIRTNCVSPGIIMTDFHSRMTPEQKEHNLKNRVPLHEFGTAQQVAEVITLLVTNDHITGENYVIDGGLTSRIA